MATATFRKAILAPFLDSCARVEQYPMAQGRILLVEDNDYDAELTMRVLRKHHLANEVLRLRDGVEALDYLYRRGEFEGRGEGNPAAVLLDLKMPKVDGMEVLREIRSNKDLASIPVVVMIGSSNALDLSEANQGGINAYVVKPLDFNAFVGAVEQTGLFWSIVNEPPGGPH